MENKEDIINFLIMLDLQRMAEIDALSWEGYVALTNLQYNEKIANLHIRDVVKYINDMSEEVNEGIQNIRKQVCEEIKREIANLENIELSSYITLCNIIDKIEQAKESIK